MVGGAIAGIGEGASALAHECRLTIVIGQIGYGRASVLHTVRCLWIDVDACFRIDWFAGNAAAR